LGNYGQGKFDEEIKEISFGNPSDQRLEQILDRLYTMLGKYTPSGGQTEYRSAWNFLKRRVYPARSSAKIYGYGI
jgi:hypothetical protein